jgi:hypothetical protein
MTVESVIDLLISRGLIDESQREETSPPPMAASTTSPTRWRKWVSSRGDQLFQLVAQDIGGEFYDLTGF